MKNKFAVRSCCYCKKEVPAGAGTVWNWRGRWYGKHDGCKKGATAPNVVAFPVQEDTPSLPETTEAGAEEFAAGLAAGVPRVSF